MVCPKICPEWGGARADQHPSHNTAGSEPGALAVQLLLAGSEDAKLAGAGPTRGAACLCGMWVQYCEGDRGLAKEVESFPALLTYT